MPIIGLTQTVAPTFEPVDIEEARLHCKVDYSEDDSLIASLITAARQFVEEATQRQLITATWRLSLDRFPQACGGIGYETMGEDARVIRLPRPRLQSVTSVVYSDSAGSSTTLSASGYRVDTYTEPGRITPVYGSYWPYARWQTGAVVITYVTGYGATAATVPQAIKQAILLLIGHWYQNREAVTLSQIPAALQFAVDALLSPYRVMEYR